MEVRTRNRGCAVIRPDCGAFCLYCIHGQKRAIFASPQHRACEIHAIPALAQKGLHGEKFHADARRISVV